MHRVHADDSPEETLDPVGEAGWAEFRELAHRMVDDMLDHLSGLSTQPAWRPVPTEVRAALTQAVPRTGIGADAAYREFLRLIQPYPNGNLHPRFWGWVQGNGTPLGMMADMLAAGLNPHLGGFDQAPAMVEHQVIGWLAELLELPRNASGLLVTGGSMANILGVTVARYAKLKAAGLDVREHGLQGEPGASSVPRLVCYGSAETHGWAQKAVELLGIGNTGFRRIAVGPEYRMDLTALTRAVARDRASGALPCCVIGTAGTVNTGATDDLEELAEFCREQKIWFHVDGAFGALLKLSQSLSPIVRGLEHADSVGFDLHKWGYLPFECACILVRNPELHWEAFATSASYLAEESRGVIAGGLPFADRGIDLTRGFKALKVWLSFLAHGSDRYARLIEQNVAQARYLTQLVEADPDLQLLAPTALNIVCFRYAPAETRGWELNDLNREILLRLQERGVAVPSATVLGGQFAIRCANVNHRSTRADFRMLVEAVIEIGKELLEEAEPESGRSPETVYQIQDKAQHD
jgi:glutamate/tyrosine decarboxylase-like PLP-dependent enzyme